MEDRWRVKEETHRLVDQLPENVSWADFPRPVNERQRIDQGIANLDAGIVWTIEQ